jgi:hypothetical protein
VNTVLVLKTSEGIRVMELSGIIERQGHLHFAKLPMENAKVSVRGEVMEFTRKGKVYAILPCNEYKLVDVPDGLEDDPIRYAVEEAGYHADEIHSGVPLVVTDGGEHTIPLDEDQIDFVDELKDQYDDDEEDDDEEDDDEEDDDEEDNDDVGIDITQ